MYQLKMKYLLTSLLFTFAFTANGQNIDSLKNVVQSSKENRETAKALHKLSAYYALFNPDSALYFGKEARDITINGPLDSLHIESIHAIANAFTNMPEPDSMLRYTLQELAYYKNENNYKGIAISYKNMAVYGQLTKNPDTSLYFIQKALNVLEKHPDSVLIGDALYSKSFALQNKGKHEEAIEAILEGLRIFEKLDDSFKIGFMQHMLATNNSRLEKYEEAIDWNLKSIKIWEEFNSKMALVHAYNNTGGAYRGIEDYKNALLWHRKANTLCKEVDQKYVQMLSAYNIGQIYFEIENIDSSEIWLNEAKALNEEFEIPFIKGGIAIKEANISFLKGNGNLAYKIQEANASINQQVDPIEKNSNLKELAKLYEIINQPQKALDAWRDAQIIQDSVITVEMNTEFEELKIQYQTEKKDAEIALLSKEAELNDIRKKGLWGGIFLLLLSGISIIYSLITRAKKKEAILSKEKELADEKRQQAERELEFKKKELTAKALQLASKNKFLQSLEKEVSTLNSSVDGKVSQTTQKITRMINNDALDDDEWDQFQREFSSIHQHFIDKITKEYGDFSNHEWRLLSLLKMNLSSKEIANILRISPDGVKKARYRLRKKINLQSEVDIQDFLLSY